MRLDLRRAAAGLCLGWIAGCSTSVPAGPSTPDAAPPSVAPPDASSPDASPAPDAAPSPTDTAQPPPLAGGTLAITRDGTTAIVSDPDSDRVLLVDLARRAVTATLALQPGDEPGRVVDGDGRRAFVALRGGGAVLTVDLMSRAVTERRALCPQPRGLAWDDARGALHVACMGGELVTVGPVGMDGLRSAQLDRDLRDVAVVGDRLLVTRLRSAEVLVVDDRRVVTQRLAAATTMGTEAGVARRMIPAPGGGVWLLHQRAGTSPVTVSTTGYYSAAVTCPGTEGVTRPALTRVQPPFAPTLLPDIPNAALAVDIAANADGTSLALAVPGAFGSTSSQVVVVPTAATGCLMARTVELSPRGQVVALAYAPGNRLVVQTRSPAELFVAGAEIALGGPDLRNEGHTLFHTNTTGTVACASCHVEGEDDGRVWTFAPAGPRRTPHLRGGLLGTEPFHWSGDLPDFRSLVESVMVRGMRAPMPSDAGIASLARWVDRLPRRVAPPSDGGAVARGETLFRSAETGCATCHAGPHFTNGATVDVGTGGTLQVPPLHGLAWHAPYLHNGCAATLRDRFGACGGGDRHGHTSQLTSAQVGDLVAFLETL